MRHLRDSLLYAFLIGLLEHLADANEGWGRTHDTLHDWSDWYDRGWNAADALTLRRWRLRD